MKSNLSFFKLGLLAVITAVISYAPSVQAATSNAKQTFAVEEINAKKDKGAKPNKANKERVKKDKIQQFNAKKGEDKQPKLDKPAKNKNKKNRPNDGKLPN